MLWQECESRAASLGNGNAVGYVADSVAGGREWVYHLELLPLTRPDNANPQTYQPLYEKEDDWELVSRRVMDDRMEQRVYRRPA